MAGYASNLGVHAVAASVGLLDAGVAANAFHLAQHEGRDLAAPADWRLLQRLGAYVYRCLWSLRSHMLPYAGLAPRDWTLF